jgi:hypothetical protein
VIDISDHPEKINIYLVARQIKVIDSAKSHMADRLWHIDETKNHMPFAIGHTPAGAAG